MFTTGKLLDSSHDFVAVHEKLVSNHDVTGEDDEPVALDHAGMRVGGVGGADKGWPMVANGVLRRLAANLMFLKELLDDDGERLRRATLGPRRIVGGSPAQFADEFFGDFAEMRRFVRHDFECSSRNTRGGEVATAVN